MNEDIDTAAIRHSLVYFARQDGDGWAMATMRDLCDALDAARAEAKCDHGKWRCKWGSDQRDRAEAAEAELERRDEAIRVRQNAAAYAEPKDLS